MKKVVKKHIFFRVLVLLIASAFLFVVSKVNFDCGDDLKYIYGSFIGQKSPYTGIIEVWNIDSFESGIKSKCSFLEEQAKKFQRRYKGVSVLVRSLTENECLNSLRTGDCPDIISCSYGVSNKIREYLRPINLQTESSLIFENFLNAGKSQNDEIYGLAWCVGFYALISTKAKLEKAGKEIENVKLNEIAYSSGYEYKSGKKQKFSKSLIFGAGDYLMPKMALKAYNKARSIQKYESENDEIILKSQNSAYTSFLSNNATILLGTHRDVFKMLSREENGKASDVVYLPLTNWTDLVQFSFICKIENTERREMAEKFAIFLTEIEAQESLEKIGMFPVIEVKNTQHKGIMRDIILENFSNYELKNVFEK